MIPFVILFIVSLAVLVKASDFFVSSAEDIGLGLGISPFIIGLTIVAFGTSLPELAASISAVMSGNSEIVLGNVVGSNITNILLVLGLTAVVSRPIRLDYDVMDSDMPLLLISAFLFWLIIRDQHISVFDALILLAGLFVFLYNSLKSNKDDLATKHSIKKRNYFLLPASAVLVYWAAKYVIVAIVALSESLNIPSEVIALTAVALGTSLPEVVVSITAARKGKSAIAVGNVLGSNIFNTYAVVGISAFVGEVIVTDEILTFMVPLMLIVTVLFAFICLSKRINSSEGFMLILLYLFFLYASIS